MVEKGCELPIIIAKSIKLPKSEDKVDEEDMKQEH